MRGVLQSSGVQRLVLPSSIVFRGLPKKSVLLWTYYILSDVGSALLVQWRRAWPSLLDLSLVFLVFLVDSGRYEAHASRLDQRCEQLGREIIRRHIHALPAGKIGQQPPDHAVGAAVPKLGVPLQLGASVRRIIDPVDQVAVGFPAPHRAAPYHADPLIAPADLVSAVFDRAAAPASVSAPHQRRSRASSGPVPFSERR